MEFECRGGFKPPLLLLFPENARNTRSWFCAAVHLLPLISLCPGSAIRLAKFSKLTPEARQKRS